MKTAALTEFQIQNKIADFLTNSHPEGTTGVSNLQINPEIGKGIDMMATFGTASGAQIPVVIEVKNTQHLSELRNAMRQVKQYAQEKQAVPMVAGVFWGERARKVAKEEQVGLLDLAGNFYLQKDPVYIETKVAKNPFRKSLPLNNLFAPISTRIIRALLIEPKRMWELPLLAKATDVSIGQAYKVVDRLVAEEFGIRTTDKQFLLTKPAELLDEWSKVYTKDKNTRVIYYSFERNLDTIFSQIDTASKKLQLRYALGYFSGALFVAPFIRGLGKAQLFVNSPEDILLYKKEMKLELVESGGNVEFFIPYDQGVFYGLQKIQGIPIVSTIQLYLDLINNPARGEEQAQHLRDVVLKL